MNGLYSCRTDLKYLSLIKVGVSFAGESWGCVLTLLISLVASIHASILKRIKSVKLIIYSSNFAPELTGIGKFNGELAARLVDHRVETHVITAPPYYPEWQVHENYRNFWSRQVLENGVVVHRSPIYVPKVVTTAKRLLHLMSFAITSIFNLVKFLLSRPDVVIVVQPSFFCAPATLVFCALTRAKSVMHIQDFELDAMLGLGMSSGSKRWDLFRKLETFIMRRFDMVSSISFSMLEKAKKKGVDDDKLVLFPNWADTKTTNPGISGADFRAKWGVLPGEKVVLYAGNLGNKQGLEIVLEVAEAYLADSKVKFFIVGSGTSESRLKALAAEKKLTNLEFKPLQPYELLPQMLAMADVHLVVQKKGVADSVLPSKLTAILAAGGHALVTAEAGTELGKIANVFPGIYRLVAPENTALFIKALDECLVADTSAANTVAREYAVDNLNKDRVIDRFVSQLDALTERKVSVLPRKNNVE